ncbi:CHASE2 domain-containing protein [Hylemonella gracilis]|uniref:CHASE2 domain-containing protein n=1 Tax=Hylemonella gracilis TaxID=80880 RepID=A0A4P6UM42_9BURK|nr:CHASE2 domain-containing protein [Hylemonella gracilis]
MLEWVAGIVHLARGQGKRGKHMGRNTQAGKARQTGMAGKAQDAAQAPRGARGPRWVSLLLALVSVVGVVWLYYAQNDFLESFEARSYDLRFKSLRGPLPVQSDITIIAIDDKSIAALGRYPWTRQQYVRLLDKLEAIKPRVVLFDVFFPEPESTEVDNALARALARAGNVVLASTFAFDAQGRVTGRTGSLPALEAAAAGRGHINLRPEDDGVNRRNDLQITYQDGPSGQTRLMPALGLSAALFMLGADTFGAEPFRVWIARGQELLRSVPVNGDGALWINYLGSAGAYPRVSFVDVLEGRVDPVLLRDKAVFLGATALGVYDMRVTPFHPNTPGVEVHAAVADNILSQRYIHRTGMQALFDLLMIVVIGFLSFAFTARLRLQRAIPAVLGLVALYLCLAYGMFLQGQWVSMVYPPVAAVLALLLGGAGVSWCWSAVRGRCAPCFPAMCPASWSISWKRTRMRRASGGQPRGDRDVHRHQGLHYLQRAQPGRGGGGPPERVPVRHGADHPRARRDGGQVHGRRHHGLLGGAAAAARPCPPGAALRPGHEAEDG